MTTVIGSGTLTKIPCFYDIVYGSSGSPAVAAVPDIPGYWTTETVTYCVLGTSNIPKLLDYLYGIVGSQVLLENTYIKSGRLCTNVKVPVYVQPIYGSPYIPEVLPTEDQGEYDFQLGWNARVRSIEVLSGDGYYSFVVPSDVIGAMVGLAVSEPQAGYADMGISFYVRKGIVSIYEWGKMVQSIGSYPNATLKIRRASTVVQYFVNGTMVREVAAPVMGKIWLSAGLYSGNDRVASPVFQSENTAFIGGNVAAVHGLVADGPFFVIDATVPVCTGSIGINLLTRIFGTVAPVAGYLSDGSTFIYTEAPPVNGYVLSESEVPAYAIIGGVVMPAVSMINVFSGGIVSIDESTPVVSGFVSDHKTAMIFGTMAAAQGSISDAEADEALIDAWVKLSFAATPVTELVAFISSNGSISGLMSVSMIHSAEMLNAATLELGMSLQMQIEAIMRSAAAAVSGLLPPTFAGEAWVLNTDAGGMTRYESYDFNSFANIDGRAYGARADGIYLLEGETDDGTAVSSSVNFGSMNFGSSARKAMPYVYAGMAANGATYLRVTVEGKSYTYQVRHHTEEMKTHRFELGRGLAATFYEVELLSEGTVFDLESIDFQPIKLSRSL